MESMLWCVQGNMNILLFENDELQANHLQVDDYRAKHIVKVLKGVQGDTLRIGLVGGKMGVGTIVSIHQKFPFFVEMSVVLNGEPPPTPQIDLLLALPRPIMLKRILSQATALGIGRIFLVNASRVEKSFWSTSLLSEKEYRPHMIHGLEQAVDTRLPELLQYRKFIPFVEDIFPMIVDEYSHLVVAHPHAELDLSKCVSGEISRILYAVGPEGGWVDFEVEKLLSIGMCPFSMGTRILKVDTAVVAIHSRISGEIDRR